MTELALILVRLLLILMLTKMLHAQNVGLLQSALDFSCEQKLILWHHLLLPETGLHLLEFLALNSALVTFVELDEEGGSFAQLLVQDQSFEGGTCRLTVGVLDYCLALGDESAIRQLLLFECDEVNLAIFLANPLNFILVELNETKNQS